MGGRARAGRQQCTHALGGDTHGSPAHCHTRAYTTGCRKENNGNDPTISLVPKGSSGWATSQPPAVAGASTSPPDSSAAGVARVIPAQPSAAWGGLGLPDERKRQLELASKQEFPTLGTAGPGGLQQRPPPPVDERHAALWEGDDRGGHHQYGPPYGPPQHYDDRLPPPHYLGGQDVRGGHFQDRHGAPADRYGGGERGRWEGPPGERAWVCGAALLLLPSLLLLLPLL